MNAVIEAAAAGDTEAAARAAHALKSMSFNIGAKAVAELAGGMESKARERGQVTSADAETLHRKLLATLAALVTWGSIGCSILWDAWKLAHVLTYPNGQRQIIFM